MKIFLKLIALTLSIQAVSQPNTDIYLFNIGTPGQSPINISNNPGYDNQPSFWNDSQSILYARTVNGQTEIARYFIESGKTEIITNTLQGSEYSPTQIPGTNNISSIRLDTTGLQLLYKYDLHGKSSVLVPNLKIGYHAWVNSNELAAFVLGEPMTLQRVNVETGVASVFLENPGRSVHPFPSDEGFSYVDNNQEPPRIFLYQSGKNFKDGLIDLPEGTQDYCWSADGRMLFSSQESTILISNQGLPWKPFIDLKVSNLRGTISRLAASPDGKWLAVVVENQ